MRSSINTCGSVADGFVYDDGQLVHFNMTFYDFPMNQSLSFDYEFWNDYGFESEIGEFAITINEHEQAYTLNLSNLSDGCYYLTLMPHDAEDMNDYWAQFAVGEILDDDGEVISCWYPSVHIDTLYNVAQPIANKNIMNKIKKKL